MSMYVSTGEICNVGALLSWTAVGNSEEGKKGTKNRPEMILLAISALTGLYITLII